jgi:hypothetical protein
MYPRLTKVKGDTLAKPLQMIPKLICNGDKVSTSVYVLTLEPQTTVE